VWNQSFIAEPPPGNRPELERYFPLTNVSVPIELNSELLAFYATSQSANSNWKLAAYVKRKYLMGVESGGDNTAIVDSKKIFLNQFSLLQYPDNFDSNYSLIISFPYWLRDISLSLWKYKKVSDPFFDKVVLLLHGNGTNIVDSSQITKTINTIGNAKTSTAKSKFGGSSLLFDGVSSALTISGDLQMGNQNFTGECWFYPLMLPVGGNLAVLWAQRPNLAAYGGPTLAISSAGNLLLFIANSNGSGWEIVGFDTQITVSLNEWQHIALVRNDSQLLTYKNGVAGSSVGINFSIASTGDTSVGAGSASGGQWISGYLDELRITKGVARYTSNFVPPTKSFPNS